MGYNLRHTQHKPTREDRNNEELRKLRSENQSLRKQVARLRRLAERSPVPDADDQEVENPTPTTNMPVCMFCESTNIKSAQVYSGILNRCFDCSKIWRT